MPFRPCRNTGPVVLAAKENVVERVRERLHIVIPDYCAIRFTNKLGYAAYTICNYRCAA